jgi:hypothetical protein
MPESADTVSILSKDFFYSLFTFRQYELFKINLYYSLQPGEKEIAFNLCILITVAAMHSIFPN